jgi:hypothetical protein
MGTAFLISALDEYEWLSAPLALQAEKIAHGTHWTLEWVGCVHDVGKMRWGK